MKHWPSASSPCVRPADGDVAQGVGRAGVAGRALQAGVEEVGHLAAELVERSEKAGVELVILLEQLFEDRLPDAVGGDLGMAFAAAGADALVGEQLAVDLAHVLRRLARLARHRRPHLELLDGLVQGVVHDERRRVLEEEFAAGDRQQGAVDVPEDGADLGQADEVRLGLGAVHLRGGRPGQVARVEIGGVLFERQGHVRPLLLVAETKARVAAGRPTRKPLSISPHAPTRSRAPAPAGTGRPATGTTPARTPIPPRSSSSPAPGRPIRASGVHSDGRTAAR